MKTETNTLQQVAQEFADAFESKQRDNGETYATRKDGCAPWIDSDVCMEIHKAIDDRLPNDWVYNSMWMIADALTGYETADDMREAVSEIADGLVDVCNSDLTAWLASHNLNACLCDDAAREFGADDKELMARIQAGQYYGLERIAYAVIDAIVEEADDRE